MRILCDLIFLLAVDLNFIDLSLQSKRLPDGDSNPGVHRCRPSPSSPPKRHCANETHFQNEPYYSNSSLQTAETPLRDGLRSPTFRPTFSSILGFRFEDLALLRLIPHDYPNRIFELRRYVFPTDEQIQLRTKYNVALPMPPGEQIVLSASNGDIYAKLEKTSSKHTILRAIFTRTFHSLLRAKINMNSGAVELLTAEEIMECPVSTEKLTIAKSYRVLRLSPEFESLPNDGFNPDFHRFGPSSSFSGVHYSGATHYPTLSAPPAEPPLRDRSNSLTLRRTFAKILRYRFEDLASIRLVPLNHPNRIFELRIYAFPSDEQLRLRTRNQVLDPMPTGEQIVLSTSHGDVCAILEKTSSDVTALRPIFKNIFGISERVKINMNSGVVLGMTKEEIAECPGTSGKSIPQKYSVSRV